MGWGMRLESGEKLKYQIKRHEGYSNRPYKDSMGVWTGGWGHNLEVDPTGVPDGVDLASWLIPEELAEQWFNKDFNKALFGCLEKIPFFGVLSDVRQAALVNMAFNLGIKGLLKFKLTLGALESGAYYEAARQMIDSHWARQVGVRASELVFQMLTGEWLK